MDYSNLREGDETSLRTALVTGASGLLGQEISRRLAAAGWQTGLIGRNEGKLELLVRGIAANNGTAFALAGDLAEAGEANRLLSDAADLMGSVHLLVHAASPPILSTSLLEPPSDFEQQMTVNVRAFLDLAAAMLPDMLRAQSGTFVAILSQALLPPSPAGWQTYTIAKAGLAQTVSELSQAYSAAGIRSFAVFPSMLAPSADRPGVAPESARQALAQGEAVALAPSEVARRILMLIEDESAPSGTGIALTPSGEIRGNATLSMGIPGSVSRPDIAADSSTEAGIRIRLAAVMHRVFNLAEDIAVENGGLGTLPSWDSLGHIKLIMEVESEFGVTFDTMQSTEILTFDAIAKAITASNGI